MDEYQARSWQAWYHHMALVMMALVFLLKERRLQRMALPLLSASDVCWLGFCPAGRPQARPAD